MLDLKKKQIISNYSKTAKTYDSRYNKIQKEKYEVVFSKIKDKIPKGFILDLGCGTGLFQKYLNSKNKKINLVNTDLVFEMIKKLKNNSDFVVVSDADFLPFKSNSMDALFSFTVLQNLPNLENTLNEIKRVVKPGSLVVLTYLKKFSSKITPKIEKNFTIQEKFICGEDICFILNFHDNKQIHCN